MTLFLLTKMLLLLIVLLTVPPPTVAYSFILPSQRLRPLRLSDDTISRSTTSLNGLSTSALFRRDQVQFTILFSSPVPGADASDTNSVEHEKPDGKPRTLRSRLRKMTGFSLSAFRATMRATTGFSLTALRTTVRAATGASVTGTMKAILSLFPTWIRYFLQPFLILYYTPLMIVRCWVGPTRNSRAEAVAAHERVVEGWKQAIDAAEGVQRGGYWPVHVNADGVIVAALPPHPDEVIDLTNAVAESIEVAALIDSD